MMETKQKQREGGERCVVCVPTRNQCWLLPSLFTVQWGLCIPAPQAPYQIKNNYVSGMLALQELCEVDDLAFSFFLHNGA